MVEKSLSSSQSMGQMLSGFIREGLLRSPQVLDAGQEAVALGEGTGTITIKTGITGGEVEVEVGIGMIVTGTVEGIDIITIEAGAEA